MNVHSNDILALSEQTRLVVQKVKKQFDDIVDTYMLSDTYSVLVALSGGQDSIALLYILKQLELKYAYFTLHAGHIVHNTQEKKEQEHEITVVDMICKQLQVPLHREQYRENTVATDTRPQSMKNEAEARSIRYACLYAMAQQHAISVIATAHHRDDIVETFLMRLFRAEGLRGLTGIAPVSIIGEQGEGVDNTVHNILYHNQNRNHNKSLLLLRPLLAYSKQDLVVLAEEALSITPLSSSTAEYHFDKSNDDNSILRNKIRNTVCPSIREVSSHTEVAIIQIAKDIRHILKDSGQRDFHDTSRIVSSLIQHNANEPMGSHEKKRMDAPVSAYPWFVVGDIYLPIHFPNVSETIDLQMMKEYNQPAVLQLSRYFFLQLTYTQKIHVLLLAANQLGLRRVAKKTLDYCVRITIMNAHKNQCIYIKHTLFEVRGTLIRWKKVANQHSIRKRHISNQESTSSRLSATSPFPYTVIKNTRIVFDGESWHIDTGFCHDTTSIACSGLEYELYYKENLVLTQVHKYDTIKVNNTFLNIADILRNVARKHLIVMKDKNDIIMVPGACFLQRMLTRDLDSENTVYREKYFHSATHKRCKVMVLYHSLQVIL